MAGWRGLLQAVLGMDEMVKAEFLLTDRKTYNRQVAACRAHAIEYSKESPDYWCLSMFHPLPGSECEICQEMGEADEEEDADVEIMP